MDILKYSDLSTINTEKAVILHLSVSKIVDVTSAYRAHKLVQGKEMIWKNVGIRHATYPIDVSQTR